MSSSSLESSKQIEANSNSQDPYYLVFDLVN